MTDLTYTGHAALESMEAAVNYNRFLESELLAVLRPSDRTLDFGAGSGEFCTRLKNQRFRVECVEPDPYLRHKLEQEGFKCFATPPIVTSVYDGVYSINVLEHIEHDLTCLKIFHGQMKQGGKLFIYVPAFMSLYSRLDEEIGHFRRYTRNELCDKAREAGFTIDRVEYIDSLGFIAWYLLKLLPGKRNTINPGMVRFYDTYCFPLSRFFDRFLNKWFGKNLLLVATRP